MFITRDAYKSQTTAFLLGEGEAGWTVAELALKQTWFLVEFQDFDEVDDSGFACIQTLLLFDFKSVEHFILTNRENKRRLKSVHIVTPGHVNGSDGWKMDQLRAVWQRREAVNAYAMQIDIFETTCGKKYPASFSGLPVDKLLTDTLKFDLSH